MATCCVEQCSQFPAVCSPLSVVVNARGKKRLVIDLRYVNQFILMEKFKYEGFSIVPQLFSKGVFFISFDLKSGYHHVDIHKDCWPYLGFPWGSGSEKKCFIFKVLPFGLASACYVFTKLLRGSWVYVVLSTLMMVFVPLNLSQICIAAKHFQRASHLV